ncbi:MAG: PleD family two-component system response regulator, partial [bacterium]
MAHSVEVTGCDFPIMVVDDDSEFRMLLEITLKQAGYQVDSARNGIEALQLYKAHFYPILITDWMMPEVDGLALC